ncbi:MAG TPA: flagellar biosynthesis repressor FlbT, partial [Xanthobacteraceae bacterium]|nr:flagellar biosynthesis repressor FlbT [Xanthobacteraceae bacterium]
GEILRAVPSTLPYIEGINNQILTGNMYKALKEATRLIGYEQELITHAERGSRLRQSGEGDGKPA